MSKLRQRTRHLIYAGFTGAAVVGLLFAGYAVWNAVKQESRESRLKEEYRQQITEMEKAQLNELKSMATGWALSRDIAPGQVLKQNDLVQVRLPADAAPANLIESGEGISGKIAKIELRKGTSITEAMLYDEKPTSTDLRNRELKAVALPTNLRKGDVIDVRIQFPTGQDYIILSKKKIDNLLSPTMWITMTEEEILSLSSAMVDAFLHDASLYALTYVEPEMQGKAYPTYPVNKEVLKLISSDPNIVEKAEYKLAESVRTSLENDLAKSSTAQVSSGTQFSASDYSSSSFDSAPSSNAETSAGVPSQDSFKIDESQENKLLQQALEDQDAGELGP